VTVTDPKVQHVDVRAESATDGQGAAGGANEDGAPMFVLESDVAKPLAVVASAVPVEKGMRFAASAQFRTEGLTGGWVELALLERLPDGTEKLLENKAVKTDATGRWVTVRFTLAKSARLAQAGQLRLAVRGEFAGTVRVRKCSLVLCE
jgi:hypothetical protein